MSDAQNRLEVSILDLAAEIFNLKAAMTSLVQQSGNMAKLLNSLRETLSQQGVISELDLEAAIELCELEAVAASLPEIPHWDPLIDDEPSNH